MAYTPTEWKTGDLISAERLNKMEKGVAYADSKTFTAEDVGAIPVGAVKTIEVISEQDYESSSKSPQTLYLIPEE